MKVIDDFLSDYYFKQIQDEVLSSTFPWLYNEQIVNEEDDLYQFDLKYWYTDQSNLQTVHYFSKILHNQKFHKLLY